MRRISPGKIILPSAALLIFAVYLYSLCPTVYLIDSGELAAVSYTLGIAHPTGYPLYTLISFLFSRAPGDPLFNLNVLSAVLSLAAAVFIYLSARAVTRDPFLPVLAAFMFAFAPTVWRTTVTNEVYPLTLLFCAVLVFLALKVKSTRGFYLSAYLCGLSFTNHLSIFALVFPLCIYLVFRCRPSWRKVLAGLALAAAGATPYLYLVIRANAGAPFAWGDTHNLLRLFWHVTGRQYQVWMFSQSLSEIASNAKQGIAIIAADFAYILLVPVAAGIHYLWKKDRGKCILFAAVFAVNFLYTVNYAIPDIESYYIPGIAALTVFAIHGLAVFSKLLKWYVVLPLALLVPVINYQSSTLHANRFGRDFSLAHISQLPDSSLLISNYWDIISPALYFQGIEHFREDVVVIDKELLRRTWYVRSLIRKHPRLFEAIDKPVGEYMKELVKFEYGRPYDPYTIQFRFIRMLEALVDAKTDHGVFFALPFPDQDLQQVKPGRSRIPWGMVHAVTGDTAIAPFDFSRLSLPRPRVINDPRLAFNIRSVEQMIRNNISYQASRGRQDEALKAAAWLEAFAR